MKYDTLVDILSETTPVSGGKLFKTLVAQVFLWVHISSSLCDEFSLSFLQVAFTLVIPLLSGIDWHVIFPIRVEATANFKPKSSGDSNIMK